MDGATCSKHGCKLKQQWTPTGIYVICPKCTEEGEAAIEEILRLQKELSKGGQIDGTINH